MKTKKKGRGTLDYTVSATVDEATYKKIQQLREEQDRTTSAVVRRMLQEQIERLEQGE